MLAPVDPAIKEKIIAAYLVGFGRNRIDRELREQGIKVSHGSISNIIHAYKRHEQPSQRSQLPQPSPSSQSPPNNANISTGADMNNTDGSPLPSRIGLATIKRNSTPSSISFSGEQPFNKSDRVTTFPEQTLSEIEFKKNPDISVENHIIKNTQDFEKNGYASEDSQGQDQGQGQKGGPLSWFVNGFQSQSAETSALTDLPTATVNSGLWADADKSLPQSPTFVKTATAQPQQEELVNVEDVLEPEDLVLDKVELESISEKSIEPVPEAGRTVPGPRSIEDILEQERVAWDYYGPAWMRILNQMKKEKDQRRHELFLMDRRKIKLEEWRKRLEQMQYDLTIREGRILESEAFLPLAKKLQEMKLTLEEALPWLETIHEKAEVENVDIRTAAVTIGSGIEVISTIWGLG